MLPVQLDGTLEWPKEPRPISRVYTVRRWDEQAGELDIDFVKHGTGVATVWAYRCQEGDTVHVAGPASSMAPPSADWLLVVGDDTALPAIARLLDDLRPALAPRCSSRSRVRITGSRSQIRRA